MTEGLNTARTTRDEAYGVPPVDTSRELRTLNWHVWQPYPIDDNESLFQCSGCRVLVADSVTAQQIPPFCPAFRPRLPHILRTAVGPLGLPVLACLGCPVPPVGDWEWTCGGGPYARFCEGCHAHRLTTSYRWFQLANLCASCAAKTRT